MFMHYIYCRVGETGSIPDLAGADHYLTSTPNSKSPAFCSVGNRSRGGGGGEELCGNRPPVHFTRSLPRSAKDFSALMYRHPTSHLASLASLYANDEVLDDGAGDGSCGRRKQMTLLEGLAREMNWSLPVAAPAANKFDSYSLSVSSGSKTSLQSANESDVCSALSMSDTLLNDQLSCASTASAAPKDSSSCYARDFTYLSKPPPAYPRKAATASSSSATETGRNSSSCRRIKIRRALSRSHPDLSKLGKELGWKNGDNHTIWRALRHK